MQALDGVEFKVGDTYKFEMKFTVREEHLEGISGDISRMKTEGTNGKLDTR